MRTFPIFLDLRGRTALLVGDGPAADRRAEALAACGAHVTRALRFTPDLLDGCAIAIGAAAPPDVLRALAEAAQARGIPVNIVDRPDLCSFITPSVIDRDPVTIAVSSGGTAPVLARLLRAKIEALVPPAYGRLASLVDAFKHDLRRRWPDAAARRRVLDRLLGGTAAALMLAGRDAEARAEFQSALDAEAGSTTDGIAQAGMVFLVGAGPGAGDLMTLRGQRLLGEADVIVHDRLAGTETLDLARRDADRIYVGKARANHCMKQEDINALLVALARQGRKVVRLKGGDPFIFGRGGEEAEALRAAGVAVEVVPGVTAALACAAQSGIPLTHRVASRGVMLLTGHTSQGRLDLDFDLMARFRGTIALYMGVATLGALRDGLVAHGMDPATDAAVIENGGTAQARSLHGTLASVAAEAPTWVGAGPCLILLGQAVGRAPFKSPDAATREDRSPAHTAGR
jgi:uroporphyrin-III C-methyltransferase/precorrin-2 dehydrogenase/sirohydrochlorin ferrochelatase